MDKVPEDPEKLSKPLMVRLDTPSMDDLTELAEATGNTPAALARLAVKALVKAYVSQGRKVTFPMEMAFIPVESLPMAAEDQAPYRSTPRSKDRPA